MKEIFQEARPLDFYSSNTSHFKQIKYAQIKGIGWAPAQAIVQYFQKSIGALNTKFNQTKQKKLITQFLGQQTKIVFYNFIAIEYFLSKYLNKKPFAGQIRLLKTQMLNQNNLHFQSQLKENLHQIYRTKKKFSKQQNSLEQVMSIKNIPALLNIKLSTDDAKYFILKWQFFLQTNNFHFFIQRPLKQKINKKKQGQKLQFILQYKEFGFQSLQRVICVDKQYSQISLKNKVNEFIDLKPIDVTTKYFFKLELTAQNEKKVIYCTSGCYFYCQSKFSKGINSTYSKSRYFKCIQRRGIKYDCLQQSDAIIQFKQKSNRQFKMQQQTAQIKQNELKKLQQKLWKIQAIIPIKNTQKNPSYYKYLLPLPVGFQIESQNQKQNQELQVAQEYNQKGVFIFDGFSMRVDYPLKIQYFQFIQKQQATIKPSQCCMQIKVNIFKRFRDLLSELKYKYEIKGDLTNNYKFKLHVQRSNGSKEQMQEFQCSDFISNSYKKINIQYDSQNPAEKVVIQIIKIQAKKIRQYTPYSVILQQKCLVSIIDKQKGLTPQLIKSNDLCLTYDQNLDDTDQNKIIKIQKISGKEIPLKIYNYNLQQPKRPYQTNFISSDNIKFSVGKDFYANAQKQQFVCDIYPRESYSQNRFKALRNKQIKDLKQFNFYEIAFQKSDFVLNYFPVRINRNIQVEKKIQKEQITIQLQINQPSRLQQIHNKRKNISIYLYNKQQKLKSFKHLIQPEFYKLFVKQQINYTLKQFCILINKNVYSVYDNFQNVIRKDSSLKNKNCIKVDIIEIPKVYFQREIGEHQRSQFKMQQKISIDSIKNAIQKYNNPKIIDQIENPFLKDYLIDVPKRQTQYQYYKKQNNSIDNEEKKIGILFQTYYILNQNTLISQIQINEENKQQKQKVNNFYFYFRDMLKVQSRSEEQNKTVLKLSTYNLFQLNDKTCYMAQKQKSQYYILPYTYFYIEGIKDNKIFLKQIPCNISFSKNIVIWMDPNVDNNYYQKKMIKKNPFLDLIQMDNSYELVRWFNVFGQIAKKLNLQIQIITNKYKIKPDVKGYYNYAQTLEQLQKQKIDINKIKQILQKFVNNQIKILNQLGGFILIKKIEEIQKQNSYTNILRQIMYCSDKQMAVQLQKQMKMSKSCLVINDISTLQDFFKINFFIACDKFRGSLQSKQVAKIINNTLNQFFNKKDNIKMTCKTMQIADGGQGTLNVIKTHNKDGQQIALKVSGPLDKIVKSGYYIKNRTAYIQMAQCSGLNLLKQDERNPAKTTTKGVGQLILHAISKQVTRIYIFVGGSATNEGGIGMASVLGYKFLNIQNKQLIPVGAALNFIHKIIPPPEKIRKQMASIEFVVLTDVNNQFYGPNGATYIYGPQKGAATQEQLSKLDRGLINLNNKIIQCKIRQNINLQNIPGSGAAGGLAGGCVAFLGAKIQKGTEYIMQLININRRIQEANIVITGQGRLDRQTLNGKVVIGVVRKAQQLKKECWIICGICQFTKSQKQQFFKAHPYTKIIELAQNQQDVKQSILGVGKRIQQKLTQSLKQKFPEIENSYK